MDICWYSPTDKWVKPFKLISALHQIQSDFKFRKKMLWTYKSLYDDFQKTWYCFVIARSPRGWSLHYYLVRAIDDDSIDLVDTNIHISWYTDEWLAMTTWKDGKKLDYAGVVRFTKKQFHDIAWRKIYYVYWKSQ